MLSEISMRPIKHFHQTILYWMNLLSAPDLRTIDYDDSRCGIFSSPSNNPFFVQMALIEANWISSTIARSICRPSIPLPSPPSAVSSSPLYGNGSSPHNAPQFLMQPADLISEDYRLAINVAHWHLSNMMRPFSCSNICRPILNFLSQRERGTRGAERWVSGKDICHDSIKMTLWNQYPRGRTASNEGLYGTAGVFLQNLTVVQFVKELQHFIWTQISQYIGTGYYLVPAKSRFHHPNYTTVAVVTNHFPIIIYTSTYFERFL
jgi:hypothetical protein